MNENKPVIILPFWETIRRSFSYILTNFNALVKISAAWFALLLVFDMFTNFPSLCSLNAAVCNGGWAQNVSLAALTVSAIAVIISYIRHIVLHADYSGYWNLSFGKRELRYIGAAFVFILIIAVPSFIYGFVAGFVGAILGADKIIFTQIFFLGLLVMLVFCARFYLVFPAVALDNREVGFRKSFRITKGNTNKIFWGQMVIMLPVFAALLILSVLFRAIGSDSYVVKMLFAFLMLSVSFLDAGLKASYFAHIYQYFMYFSQKQEAEIKETVQK